MVDSLTVVDTPPTVSFPLETLGLYSARAVAGKPETFIIDFVEISPEYNFSFGKRLKGRPYRLAKSYLVARELQRKGSLTCEIKNHSLTVETATVHHRKQKDLHVAKYLGLACQADNSRHGSPLGLRGSSDLGVSEKTGGGVVDAGSLECVKHDPERAGWDGWLEGGECWGLLKGLGCLCLEAVGGPFFLVQDLCELAVSRLVDPVFGKGSSVTYRRYAREDRFSVLEMLRDGGRWWVRPRRKTGV